VRLALMELVCTRQRLPSYVCSLVFAEKTESERAVNGSMAESQQTLKVVRDPVS